jgi:hypothetical protein
MTHDELVRKAAAWLRRGAIVPDWRGPRIRNVRCSVVLTECAGGGGEIPDAIGFAFGARWSVLIECKTSRSDFLADAKKWHRRPCMKRFHGLGMYRYFLAPAGLLKFDEMPRGWGLLEVHGRSVQVVRVALQREPDHAAEKNVLWSALREAQAAT